MNLANHLFRSARRLPGQPAVIERDCVEHTYATLARRTLALAGALRTRLGVVPGDRVALVMRNNGDAIVVGIARSGAVELHRQIDRLLARRRDRDVGDRGLVQRADDLGDRHLASCVSRRVCGRRRSADTTAGR